MFIEQALLVGSCPRHGAIFDSRLIKSIKKERTHVLPVTFVTAERIWNAGNREPQIFCQRLRESCRHPSQPIHVVRESDEFRGETYVLQSHFDPVSSCGVPKAPDVGDTRCSETALHSQGFSRSSESLFALDDIGGDLVEPGSSSDDLRRFEGQRLASYYVMSGS